MSIGRGDMSQFTKAEIDADMAMLTDKIASGGTVIASSSDIVLG